MEKLKEKDKSQETVRAKRRDRKIKKFRISEKQIWIIKSAFYTSTYNKLSSPNGSSLRIRIEIKVNYVKIMIIKILICI